MFRQIAATAVLTAAVLAAGVGLGIAVDTEPPAAEAEPSEARVVVVDRTSGTWAGIRKAVRSWDRSDHLTVELADQCAPDTYCVVVQHPTEYGRDWFGYWQPIARHVSTVQLNTAPPAAAQPRVQQWIACHEIGHALGLGETYTGEAACMRDTWQAPDQPTTATAADQAMLDRVAAGRAPEGTALAFYAD